VRYSCATVSLPTLEPARAVHLLAECGVTGVEWRVGEAPHARSTDAATFLVNNRCTLDETEAAADEAGRLSRAAGLAVVGLTPYVASGDIAHLRVVLAMAVAAGTTQVRLQGPRFTDPTQTYRELSSRFLDFLRDGVREASALGVRLVIELHHRTIVPSVGLAMPLLARFDPTELGVIYDVGNMVHEGHEDPRIGLELLGPYLHHVHLKNAAAQRDADGRWGYRWSPLDDGLVDVAAFLHLLKEHGYDGWVSLEDLSTDRKPTATLRYNAAVLTRLQAPDWHGPPDLRDAAPAIATAAPPQARTHRTTPRKTSP